VDFSLLYGENASALHYASRNVLIQLTNLSPPTQLSEISSGAITLKGQLSYAMCFSSCFVASACINPTMNCGGCLFALEPFQTPSWRTYVPGNPIELKFDVVDYNTTTNPIDVNSFSLSNGFTIISKNVSETTVSCYLVCSESLNAAISAVIQTTTSYYSDFLNGSISST